MKNTASMVVFMITFFGMYFIISMLGMVFGYTYKQSLESITWFSMYSFFLGWWIASIPARDTYEMMSKKESRRINEL